MLDTYEKNPKTKLIATLVAVLVIAGAILIIDHLRGSGTAALPQSGTTTTNPAENSNSNTSSSTTGSTYKDGSYSTDITYFVPSGQEDIKVDVTLVSDTITAVSIQNSENDHDSAGFQGDFAAGYKQYVVGKKIAGLNVKVIAGASDTAQAFNDAVNQIASRAQA